MRLIALLCWYDEPAWCLAELVSSLAHAGVDELIAVDGAYALFPGGRPQSRSGQARSIIGTAQGADMGVTVHAPQNLWFGNEIQKRTFAFELGHLIAEPGDWFWICDADEVITESIGLRSTLEETDREAATVVLDQITEDGHQGQLFMRQLFKMQPSGIRVQDNHFTYMTGDGRMLWQGMHETNSALVDAEPLHQVRVEHRQMNRSPERMRERDRYYELRRETNAELEAA